MKKADREFLRRQRRKINRRMKRENVVLNVLARLDGQQRFTERQQRMMDWIYDNER